MSWEPGAFLAALVAPHTLNWVGQSLATLVAPLSEPVTGVASIEAFQLPTNTLYTLSSFTVAWYTSSYYIHCPTTTSSSTSSYYIDLLHRLRGQFSYIALCVSPNCPSHVTQLDGRLSHIVNVIIGQMLQISIWEFGNCKLGEIYILVNCMDCMSQIDVLYLFVIHITMNEVIWLGDKLDWIS